MATIQKRKSHGKNYWYIVESRRVNGKPRPITLAYLGKAEDLLARLNKEKSYDVKSYSHGDVFSLCKAAKDLDVINIINKHLPGTKHTRDKLSVGASLLLAAIGRACHPTSKMGWYEWCESTSLELVLGRKFSKLDSQHFWDQMNFVPESKIETIEDDLIRKLVEKTGTKLDSLFFDTTNFFTYIDSMNERCDLPRRGRNKQKRFDLRQVGMALLVSREDQFPLLHRTYEGNNNDFTTFRETFDILAKRLKSLADDLSDITLIFDKGNNTKDNFKKIDNENLYYVAGLIPSHFKELIKEANNNFDMMTINDEEVPVYRIKKEVWGLERTCVVTTSKQLKEGQIQGIEQHLVKKYKSLQKLRESLESPKSRLKPSKEELKERLKKIIKGQFIDEILKYEIIELKNNRLSFTYFIDSDSYTQIKKNILGRKIHVTNRHDWSNEEICLAYRGQSKVEDVFRNLKNPFHTAIRPQYHWTDQKIKVHFFICIVGYLLTSYVYSKTKEIRPKQYSINKMMEDLKSIRLVNFIEKKEGSKGLPKTDFKLEKITKKLRPLVDEIGITAKNFKIKLPLL